MKASETTEPTLQQVAAIVCGLPPEAELEWMERNMPRKVERAKEILTLFSRSPVKATKCVSPGGCVAGKGDPPMDCGYPDCQVPVKDAAPAPVLTEEDEAVLDTAERWCGDVASTALVAQLKAMIDRLTKQAPAPVLTEDERKLVEDFKQAQREYPNASFASKWHNGLLAIIDRLTKQAPQPEENV